VVEVPNPLATTGRDVTGDNPRKGAALNAIHPARLLESIASSGIGAFGCQLWESPPASGLWHLNARTDPCLDDSPRPVRRCYFLFLTKTVEGALSSSACVR